MQLFTLCYARAGFVRLQTLFRWVLIVVVFGLKTADAAFVGDYALSNFSVTNSVNAIGSAETPDGGLTAVLTGSNTGSGLAGTTDITITSLGAGLLSFDYSYFSNDPDPGFDLAGYLLGSAFTQLADTSGQTGSVQVPLMAGQIFGFRVATVDNIGEPGVLTISNFSAPVDTGGAVPEPATWSLMLITSGLAVSGRRFLVKRLGTYEGGK